MIVGMNDKADKQKEKANIGIFCAMMVFFCCLLVLAPADKNVENIEHRVLSSAPALNLRTALNGEFSKQFEAYIADQVGFRTDFISISKGIERAYGFTPQDSPLLVNISSFAEKGAALPETGYAARGAYAGIQEQYPEHSLDRFPGLKSENADENAASQAGGQDAARTGGQAMGLTAGTADVAPKEANKVPDMSAEPVKAGPLLAFPDRLVELFGYSERACIRYAEVINGYAAALAGKQARVFSLITPTQIEFIDEKYRYMSDSQYDAIMTVYSRLDNVTAVDAYSYISEHSDEYVFFRIDHHWTALGAYYAYLAFCDAANIRPVTIDEYTEHSIPGFLGYLFSFNITDQLRDNPDTIVYYELDEPIETSGKLLYIPMEGNVSYSIFIGGDRPIFEVTTSVKNGRTCAVIKDSFGNAFIPWLAPHYEKIIVFDPREYSGSVTDMLAEYGDVDLIILNSAFSVGSGGFNNYIERIK